MAGQSDVDRVRDATDLVALIAEHLPLRPRGREHVGLCPFHDDHAPSLTVVTHKGNAFYKCHACDAAGDALGFVMAYHKMTFGEALRYLADRAGIELDRRAGRRRADAPGRDDLRRANDVAAGFFRQTLASTGGAEARALLERRGVSEETVERFALGAAPDEWEALGAYARRRGVSGEALAAAGLAKARGRGGGFYDTFRNRLIFPILDELGRTVAFGGRRLDDEQQPKYLNSPDTPLFHKSAVLYGLHAARRAIIESRRAVVCEGYTDVLACHQADLHNVVGTLGTALTREHARVLRRLCEEVVLVFDGDEAGRRAADRAVELFFAEPIDVRICTLPEGVDPADLLEAPDGRRRLDEALGAAGDALAFKVGRFRRQLEAARGPAGRHRCLEELLRELGELGFAALPGVRKRPVIAQLADLLGVGIDDIEQALPRRRPAARVAAAPPPAESGAAAATDLFADAGTDPRRRRAERELLAILIHDPGLRHQTVARDEDGPEAPLTRVVQPQQFTDAAARRLAELVWSFLERDADFTVQQLMSELEETALRRLAAELWDQAAQSLRDEPSAAEQLRGRVAAFQELRRRERYRQDLQAYRQTSGGRLRPDDALRKVLDERRKQGYIPEALPARIRVPAGPAPGAGRLERRQ